jgi:hypothetical protein
MASRLVASWSWPSPILQTGSEPRERQTKRRCRVGIRQRQQKGRTIVCLSGKELLGFAETERDAQVGIHHRHHPCRSQLYRCLAVLLWQLGRHLRERADCRCHRYWSRPPPDLQVVGGENTVEGENAQDYHDNGAGHGTHVAGIIAASGVPPVGIRGLAPGVLLRRYRVFGKNAKGSSNFAIVKSIDRAVAQECDLLNMSLGGGPADIATREAIADARDQGCLVFVASGNDDRSPVSFPASDSLCLTVSAMGRKGTFPTGATQAGDVASPYGTNKKNFMAAFSNIWIRNRFDRAGRRDSLHRSWWLCAVGWNFNGLPCCMRDGCEILSTRPNIVALPRNQARSDAMARAVLQAAKSLGFGPTYEGQGLL